jgi:hypothetical protein
MSVSTIEPVAAQTEGRCATSDQGRDCGGVGSDDSLSDRVGFIVSPSKPVFPNAL